MTARVLMQAVETVQGATLDNVGGGTQAMVLRTGVHVIVVDPDVTMVHTYRAEDWDDPQETGDPIRSQEVPSDADAAMVAALVNAAAATMRPRTLRHTVSPVVGVAVATMLHTGDLAPAARDMGTEALRQWATLHGADEWDTAYVLGVAYARGTVAPQDGADDNPLSGEWADGPTPQDVARTVETITGEPDAPDHWTYADSWESGYVDQRSGQWDEAPTMAYVLDALHRED